MLRLSPEMLLQIAYHLNGKEWLNFACCAREILTAVHREEWWSHRYRHLMYTFLRGEGLLHVRLWYGCRNCTSTSEHTIKTLQPPVDMWAFHCYRDLSLQPHYTRPCSISLPLCSGPSVRTFMYCLIDGMRYINHQVFPDEVNGKFNKVRLTLELVVPRQTEHSRLAIEGSVRVGTIRVDPLRWHWDMSLCHMIEADLVGDESVACLQYLREQLVHDLRIKQWCGMCDVCGVDCQ